MQRRRLLVQLDEQPTGPHTYIQTIPLLAIAQNILSQEIIVSLKDAGFAYAIVEFCPESRNTFRMEELQQPSKGGQRCHAGPKGVLLLYLLRFGGRLKGISGHLFFRK
jgi:hypothetical protein